MMPTVLTFPLNWLLHFFFPFLLVQEPSDLLSMLILGHCFYGFSLFRVEKEKELPGAVFYKVLAWDVVRLFAFLK